MFYIKQKLGQDLEIKADIHDENVFTRCSYFGVEINVELDIVPYTIVDFIRKMETTSSLLQYIV